MLISPGDGEEKNLYLWRKSRTKKNFTSPEIFIETLFLHWGRRWPQNRIRKRSLLQQRKTTEKASLIDLHAVGVSFDILCSLRHRHLWSIRIADFTVSVVLGQIGQQMREHSCSFITVLKMLPANEEFLTTPMTFYGEDK